MHLAVIDVRGDGDCFYGSATEVLHAALGHDVTREWMADLIIECADARVAVLDLIDLASASMSASVSQCSSLLREHPSLETAIRRRPKCPGELMSALADAVRGGSAGALRNENPPIHLMVLSGDDLRSRERDETAFDLRVGHCRRRHRERFRHVAGTSGSGGQCKLPRVRTVKKTALRLKHLVFCLHRGRGHCSARGLDDRYLTSGVTPPITDVAIASARRAKRPVSARPFPTLGA